MKNKIIQKLREGIYMDLVINGVIYTTSSYNLDLIIERVKNANSVKIAGY